MPTNSAQHDFAVIPEGTYGVTPANPVFLRKAITGTTLGLSKGKIESETISPTRQVQDVRHGNRQIGGDIMAEVAYGGHDDLIEAAMCGTWTPHIAPYVASTISAASADNSLNDSAAAFPVFVPGEEILIAGFTGTAGNNQIGHVVSRTAAKIVFTTATPFVNDAAGESVTLTSQTQLLTPGVTRRSFSMLRNFTDLGSGANPFHLFKGVELNTFELTIAPEQIVKAKWGVVGRELIFAGTAPSGTTYTPTPSVKGFDSFSGAITVDGDPVSVVTQLTMTVENGITPRFVVFDDRTQRPKVGKIRVTGQLTLYFEDSSFLIAFSGAVKRNLVFSLVDLVGNSYTFELPSILPTGGQPDVSGENDITITWPFSAIYESGNANPNSLRITRTAI